MLFTAKRPFNLPSESETGFTVKLNPDSIIKYRCKHCFSIYTAQFTKQKQMFECVSVTNFQRDVGRRDENDICLGALVARRVRQKDILRLQVTVNNSFCTERPQCSR